MAAYQIDMLDILRIVQYNGLMLCLLLPSMIILLVCSKNWNLKTTC